MSTPATQRGKTAWLALSVASGACAAFNGVFAKLTTTDLTTSWAHSIAGAFGLDPSNKLVEYAIRGVFFLLNLLFNAVMWGLFTRALTLSTSTVRVSIINTSANFMLTALLGAAIFSEALPALWFVGAAMLVAGSVIIGRREEGVKMGSAGTAGAEPVVGGAGVAEPAERFRDEPSKDSDDDGVGDAVELETVNNSTGGSK